MANHFSIFALRTPWTVWKDKKRGHWKKNSWSVGAQYATGEKWRNNSWKNEKTEPKPKQYLVMHVTGDESKVWCCKDQHCTGTWNVGPRIKANWKWSKRRWQERTSTFSVQFSSVAQLCPALCNPMNHSMPGLPVHHQLLEFTQTHVHWAGDAIQPSHPLSSPSPPATNPSQHQGLFQWVDTSHEVAKVLEF